MSPRNHNLTGRLLRTLLGLCLLITASTGQAIERVTLYHNDALGSPVAATDANGTLLWRESYAPYGKRLTQEAGSKDTVWYTGKPEEEAFGLSYFGARWYDPTIGRFLAMDPAGFDPSNIHSFGRYTYANDNPYAYVDPDGRNAKLFEWSWRTGFAVGTGLNTVAYNLTGITLSTMVATVAWNALHSEDTGESNDQDTQSTKRDKKRKYTKKDREKLRENAGGKCEYCGDDVTMEPGSGNSMEGDHITPWVDGGSTTDENGASGCRNCNRAKGRKHLGAGPGQYNPSNPNSRIKGRME